MRWLASLSRDVFSQGALYELGATLTIFEIRNFAGEFVRRFRTAAGTRGEGVSALGDDDTQAVVARDIAETTRDFIAKKLKTD